MQENSFEKKNLNEIIDFVMIVITIKMVVSPVQRLHSC